MFICLKWIYSACTIFITVCEATITYGIHKPCMGRDYNGGSQVCVCNSTYCDSVEPWLSMTDSHDRFVLYSTSKAGLRLERTIGDLKTNVTSQPINDDVESFVINSEKKFQSITGFGAGFTDAAGYNIANLSEGSREHLLRSYYSVDGIELNMGRVPIGCTEFSKRSYSYAEVPGDLYLKHFSLQPEDHIFKLPLIKRVLEITDGKLKLIATPWTAPSWMKTNKNSTGYGMLLLEYYQVWADYFVRFLKEYRDEGVDFWAVSTQNRPSKGFIEPANSPSMGWTSRSMSQFIGKYLGPTLRASPYNRLALFTVDDYRNFIPWSLYAMFKMSGTNSDAKKYVDGVGVHWYMDSLVPFENLDLCHELYPDLFIITTEAATGSSPEVLEVNDKWNRKVHLGSWERAEQYIENIMENLNHWVSGWFDWNLTLDVDGGPFWDEKFSADASVITNLTDDEFYKQPQFYALGHFSKFLPEGSVRIFVDAATTRYQTILHAAFITPDNSTVVILYNPHDDPIPVSIKNLKSEKTIFFKMPERSIHTVKYWLSVN